MSANVVSFSYDLVRLRRGRDDSATRASTIHDMDIAFMSISIIDGVTEYHRPCQDRVEIPQLCASQGDAALACRKTDSSLEEGNFHISIVGIPGE